MTSPITPYSHGEKRGNNALGLFRGRRKLLRRREVLGRTRRRILGLGAVRDRAQRYQCHLGLAPIHAHVAVVLGLMPCKRRRRPRNYFAKQFFGFGEIFQ